jgi:hypothetical protein
MRWNNIEDCEYPACQYDEHVPVWVVNEGKVISAWYSNPQMDVHYFYDDFNKEICANLWMETLSVIDKPELPI